MGGIDMLLEEFNSNDLPGVVSQKFKDIALIMKDLPMPINVRLVSKLLMVRKLYARLNPTN